MIPTYKTESIIAVKIGKSIPLINNLFSFFVIFFALLSVDILRLKGVLHKIILFLLRLVCRWVFKLLHKAAAFFCGELVNLVHVMLDRVRDGGGLDVGALLALEVHVGVDVVAAVGGMLRVQRLAAKRLQRVVVDKPPQILVVQRFDALHFMTGAKAIETVHEGVLSLDSGQMCHRRQNSVMLPAQ